MFRFDIAFIHAGILFRHLSSIICRTNFLTRFHRPFEVPGSRWIDFGTILERFWSPPNTIWTACCSTFSELGAGRLGPWAPGPIAPWARWPLGPWAHGPLLSTSVRFADHLVALPSTSNDHFDPLPMATSVHLE